MSEAPEPTSTAEIEDALLDAVELIREHWQELLTPPVSAKSGTPSTDTLTSIERRILLRREVDRKLAEWCRRIITDRGLTRKLPLDWDTLGMLTLLERHARWFSGHEDAPRAARQLGAVAHAVEVTAVPPEREFVFLGACPFLHPVEVDEAEQWPAGWPARSVVPCGGRVRARIGGDGTAACDHCGQESVTEWWEEVLGILLPHVTLPGLVPILHARLGLRVTEQTLRNWRRAGRITPAVRPEDHQPVPRPPLVVGIGPLLQWDLFDPQRVLEQVAGMDRVCVICEQPWDGGGEVCRRCWASTSKSKPKHAPDDDGPHLAGIPVTMRPRVLRPTPVVDPHDDDRPERCHYGDLPLETCMCGNPLAEEGHRRARAALEERRKARRNQEEA